MKLLCIGDSVVNGFPYSGEFSFPTLIANRRGWEVTNRGCNGEISSAVASRLKKELEESFYDMALILCGANDFIFSCENVGSVSKNIVEMAEDCFNHSVIPVIVTPLPSNLRQAEIGWMPGIDYNNVNKKIAELETVLKKWATEREVKCISLSQLCPGKMNYCDGIHPTGEGYEIIADLIIEELI